MSEHVKPQSSTVGYSAAPGAAFSDRIALGASGRAVRPLLMLLLLILPYAVYAFLWHGESHSTLGIDYVVYQPGQQLLQMQSVRDGIFPLWIPSDSGGMPASRYCLGMFYSPVTWLLFLFPSYFAGQQMEILIHVHLLHLGLAGVFMFLLLGRYGLGNLSSFVGACVFIFNFRMLGAFASGVALDTVTWLPVILYFAERWLDRPRWIWVALSAISLYMLLVAGHLQEAMYCMYFVQLYMLVRWLLAWKLNVLSAGAAMWRGLGWIIATGLGVGLAAMVLVPYVLDSLPTMAHRAVGIEEFYYFRNLSWREIVFNVFYPWLLDGNSGFYCAQSAWILTLIAIAVVMVRRSGITAQQRSIGVFAALVWLTCLLYAMGPETPVAPFLNEVIPFLKSVRVPGRVMTVGMFCAAILVALGVQGLVTHAIHIVRSINFASVCFVLYMFAGAALLIGIGVGVIELSDHHVALPVLWSPVKHSPFGIHGNPSMITSMAMAMIVIAACSMLALVFYRRGYFSIRSCVLVFLIGIVFETAFYHRLGWVLVDEPIVTPHSDTFKSVDIYHNRVYAGVAPFFMYTHEPVPQVDGQLDFSDDMPAGPLKEFLSRGGLPAWSIYYQVIPGHEMPRAYLTPHITLTDGDPLDAISKMNPYRTAIIQTEDPANHSAKKDGLLQDLADRDVQEGEITRQASDQWNKKIEVSLFNFNRVRFVVNCEQAMLLNYSDAYAEGWKARLDGREVPVYRANHLFKAVVVPPGQHEIEMRYDPESLRIAWPIFFLSAGIVILMLVCAIPVGVWGRVCVVTAVVAGCTGLSITGYHKIYDMAFVDRTTNFYPDQKLGPEHFHVPTFPEE